MKPFLIEVTTQAEANAIMRSVDAAVRQLGSAGVADAHGFLSKLQAAFDAAQRANEPELPFHKPNGNGAQPSVN